MTITLPYTISNSDTSDAAKIMANYDEIVNEVNPKIGSISDAIVSVGATQTLTNKTHTSPKVGTAIADTNGNEIIKTPATASAVNEITVTNAATGNAPVVSSTGDDANIDLSVTGKGTGKVKVTKPQLEIGSDATGDIFYRAAGGELARLAVGTNGHVLQLLAGLPAWAAASSIQTKIGTFSRDMATDTSAYGITGVGFTPKLVIVLGTGSDVDHATFGFGNATAASCIRYQNGATWSYNFSKIASLRPSGGIYDLGLTSLDADGFTVTGAKTSSPTGTGQFTYLAIG